MGSMSIVYYLLTAAFLCIQWRSLPQVERDWYNENSAKMKLKGRKCRKSLGKSLMPLMNMTEGTRPGLHLSHHLFSFIYDFMFILLY